MSLNETLQVQKEALVAALADEARERLDEMLPELRSADIAEILEEILEEDDDLPVAMGLLDSLPLERRANVLGYLPGEEQVEISTAMSDETLLAVLEEQRALSDLVTPLAAPLAALPPEGRAHAQLAADLGQFGNTTGADTYCGGIVPVHAERLDFHGGSIGVGN